MSLPEILRHLSILSPVLPIILLLTVRGKRTKAIYILTAVLLISFAADITGFFMAKKDLDPSLIYNIYFVTQFFLWMYFYGIQVKNKKPVYAVVIIFIAFFIINTAFVQPFTTYQSWLRVAAGIIFIYCSVGHFLRMSKIDKTGAWYNNPPIDPFYHYPFWINTGIFYYFTFNLFLFAVDNFVFTHMNREEALAFWGFHNFNNIMKNLLFAIAVIVFKRKMT